MKTHFVVMSSHGDDTYDTFEAALNAVDNLDKGSYYPFIELRHGSFGWAIDPSCGTFRTPEQLACLSKRTHLQPALNTSP